MNRDISWHLSKGVVSSRKGEHFHFWTKKVCTKIKAGLLFTQRMTEASEEPASSPLGCWWSGVRELEGSRGATLSMMEGAPRHDAVMVQPLLLLPQFLLMRGGGCCLIHLQLTFLLTSPDRQQGVLHLSSPHHNFFHFHFFTVMFFLDQSERRRSLNEQRRE